VGFALPVTLLPRRCALTAPFHPYLTAALSPGGRAHSDSEAVCFLWHFPSIRLEPDVPDVIRHTALWSSDFPLSAPEGTDSDRPVQLPTKPLYDAVLLRERFQLSAPALGNLADEESLAARSD